MSGKTPKLALPAADGYTALVKHVRRELQALEFIIRHQWDAEQLRGHVTGRRKKEVRGGNPDQPVSRLAAAYY